MSNPAAAQHWKSQIQALQSTQREADEELQQTLNSLKAQNELLKAEIARMEQMLSVDNKGTTMAQQQRIDKLRDLVDTYNRKIEVERRQLESMHQELDITQAKLQGLQRLTGGTQAVAESTKQMAKTRQVMENRLDQAEKRFGEALTINNGLRKEIETFNKERHVFQQQCSKLEKELAAVSEELLTVRNATSICETARTVACQQVSSLRLQGEREAAAFDAQLAELRGCQEADKALMQTHADLLVSSATAMADQGGLPTAEELDAEQCAELVGRLQQACQVNGLPGLVAHFSQLEGLNFQLFSECNQADERAGLLQKQLNELQQEALQVEEGMGSNRHKEVIRSTQTKTDQCSRRTEACNSKRVVLERRLALIRAGVGAALKSLDAQLLPAPRPEDPASVFATLLKNLGQLESRSRAVVAVHSTLAGRDTRDTRAVMSSHLKSAWPDADDLNGGPQGPGAAAGQGSGAAPGGAPDLQGRLSAGAKSFSSRGPASRQGSTVKQHMLGGRLASVRSSSSESGESDGDSDDSDSCVAVPLTREQLQARVQSQHMM